MLNAVRAAIPEVRRTEEVSFRKDAARRYRQFDTASFGARREGDSAAAVVHLGRSRGSPPPEGGIYERRVPRSSEREASPRSDASNPSSLDVLERAVRAFSQPGSPPVSVDSIRHHLLTGPAASVPFEALQRAVASQDEAMHGFRFQVPESAREPFGRDVPFDLQNPDGDASAQQS